MKKVRVGISSDTIKQGEGHVLFVEGEGNGSFDAEVMKVLLRNSIKIETLGASYCVKDVAKSLHQSHPNYYFLIDRDHHYSDSQIDDCWNNFPEPEKHNLLVWRKREFENYFLDPEYLSTSEFLKVEPEVLKEKIRDECQKRVLLDVVNYVIVSIRESMKANWIDLQSDPTIFTDSSQALDNLLAMSAFETFRGKAVSETESTRIEESFWEYLELMTGGSQTLEFGTGKWLDMIQGKKVLNMIASSECFKVVDARGKPVQGKPKLMEIAKGLVSSASAPQPDDFIELRSLISKKTTSF